MQSFPNRLRNPLKKSRTTPIPIRAASSAAFNALDVIAIASVFAAGVLSLPTPFGGDQALFVLGADKMDRGAVLYADYWDLKQPAIFWFYLVAGRLFSFTEVGIHAFELAYMLALAIVLRLSLKDYFRNRWVLSLVPLFTVGVYYAVSSVWHLTQVEGLVGLTMFLALWTCLKSPHRAQGVVWLFISGLMGGMTLLFKLMFLPILISFWTVGLFKTISKKPNKIRHFVVFASPIFLGLTIPFVLTLIYFTKAHALQQLAYTWFELPAEAVKELPWGGFGTLFTGFSWFVLTFATLIAIALIAIWTDTFSSFKFSSRPFRFNVEFHNLLTLTLLLWVGIGFAVILGQRFSWWQYHYLLLLLPIGILAARGIDLIWSAVKETHPAASLVVGVVLLVLFSPFLIRLATKAFELAPYRFAIRSADRLHYQRETTYRGVLAQTAFLRNPSSFAGDIFVFGSPLFYLLSGRSQAIPLNGWSPETMTRRQWQTLQDQLARARPPYIFISSSVDPILRRRSPQTLRLVLDNYRTLTTSDAGNWYYSLSVQKNNNVVRRGSSTR